MTGCEGLSPHPPALWSPWSLPSAGEAVSGAMSYVNRTYTRLFPHSKTHFTPIGF